MESILEQFSDTVERLRDLSEEVPLWVQLVGLFILTIALTAYPMYLLARRRANRGNDDAAPSKESLRSRESTLAMLSRFIARGLNDDEYFAADITPDHPNANELLRMNPLKPQDASGSGMGRMQSAPSLEKRLAFCIGCDSPETPAAHEDAERMQRIFDDLGYKTILLTNKTMTPSTTSLALWALQVKHSGRHFESVVVFIAGKLRTVELSRQAFVTGAAVVPPKPSSEGLPELLFLVELLVNEKQPTDVKSWIDIHMFAQRLLEATQRSATDVILIVDAQLSAEESQYLISPPTTPAERDATAYLKQLRFDDLLSRAAAVRHQPIVTIGCWRTMAEAAGAGRKAKYLGSAFVKKFVEARSGKDKEALDADTEATTGVNDEPTEGTDGADSQAFPTAYGNCRTGLYHCGVMTPESIVTHLRTVWESAVPQQTTPSASENKDAKGDGSAPTSLRHPVTPFWSSNLHRQAPLHSQDALMPRLASPYPVDAWVVGGCHTADLSSLRSLLLRTSKQRALAGQVRRSGLVVEVSATSRGVGLSSFLRRFAWASGEIRRDIIYFDLEGYAVRPPKPAPSSPSTFSFARLVSHLGRAYCNLEHQLADDEAALEFAKAVLSQVPSTVILDHYSSLAESVAMVEWLQHLASESTSTATRLWIVLGVSANPGLQASGVANAKLTLSPDPAFDSQAFLTSPGFRAPLIDAAVWSLDEFRKDEGMCMWHWVLLRGLLRISASPNSPAATTGMTSASNVTAAVYGGLSKAEKALVDYLFRFGRFAPAFGCGSLSAAALGTQASDTQVFSSWEVTQHLQALHDRGIVDFFYAMESCSPKEALLPHLRLNWAIAHHLSQSAETDATDSAAALATRIVAQYGKQTTDKALRVVQDGFFLPRIVSAMRLSDQTAEKLQEQFKFPQLAASDGTFPVLTRFLAESMRTRGVPPTIQAYQTELHSAQRNSATHPLAALPEPILSALERNATSLQTQLNELPQVLVAVTQTAENESLAPLVIPTGFWTTPLVQYKFYQNPLMKEKDAPFRAPAVCAVCVEQHADSATTLTAAAFVDQAKGTVLLGFANGTVALGTLSNAPSEKSVAVFAISKLGDAKLNGPVDTIVRHGSHKWVTASRAKHDILLWNEDFTASERVEQLTRPSSPASVSSSDDEADEEGDEGEDESGSSKGSLKRALFVHLLTRGMSQYHYEVYLRGVADTDNRSDPKPLMNPPSIYHVALLSVGRRGGARRAKQHLSDTCAPENVAFNHVTTIGFDVFRGLATISTPDDRSTLTAAAVGAAPDGTARVVLGTSSGDIRIYVLRPLPRAW